MFLRNRTSLDVSLARGRITDDVAVVAVVVRVPLRIEDAGLVPPLEPLEARETDPPARVALAPVWHGVSVTAAGHASGPPSPPFVCPVIFRVGDVERRLIVFGERCWERRFGGSLEASPAAPFDRIALGFTRAFGGGYDLPPGLLPGTDLPHPGLRVSYPLNADGVGYYPDERAAVGAPLPCIERPDQLLKHWNDTPEPAGFTPCPDLVAWRTEHTPSPTPSLAADTARHLMRMRHHAPPPLIFDDVPAGTRIELLGLGQGPLRFAVPAA